MFTFLCQSLDINYIVKLVKIQVMILALFPNMQACFACSFSSFIHSQEDSGHEICLSLYTIPARFR